MISTTTRGPLCSVTIVSNGGYGTRRIPPDLLQPSILDVTTRRALDQAAGQFQITLLPRPAGGVFGAQTWHDLVHPMDHVTIQMWVPPRKPRVVMTGFVDAILDQFSIAQGRPNHTIVIAGRDYGKLLLISKLYALDLKGERIPQRLRIFRMMQQGLDALTNSYRYRMTSEGTGLVPTSELPPQSDTSQTPGQPIGGPATRVFYTPSLAMQVLWTAFVLPRYEEMQTAYDGALPSIGNEVQVTVDAHEDDDLKAYGPYLIPWNVQPYTDLWSIFRAFQHAPWRELFWEETDEGPRLFYRSTPWLNFAGQLVQPVAPFEAVDVFDTDRVEYTYGRNDEAVFNFFFTHPAIANTYTQRTRELGISLLEGMYGGTLFQQNPHLLGVGDGRDTLPDSSSAFQRTGIRLFERETPYFEIDPNLPKTDQERLTALARFAAVKWNQKLVEAHNHGGLLEAGTLTLKGNEELKLGVYAREQPSGACAYVSGLSHRFRWGTHQDGHFLTTLTLTRGRGHLVRERKMPGGPT